MVYQKIFGIKQLVVRVFTSTVYERGKNYATCNLNGNAYAYRAKQLFAD